MSSGTFFPLCLNGKHPNSQNEKSGNLQEKAIMSHTVKPRAQHHEDEYFCNAQNSVCRDNYIFWLLQN